MKTLLTLLVISSITGCNRLKPIEMCSLKFAEDRTIDSSLCICKVRDMLKGETIGKVYKMPVDHCNKQVSFHATESWPELDAFLLTAGKKIRKKDIKNREQELAEELMQNHAKSSERANGFLSVEEETFERKIFKKM